MDSLLEGEGFEPSVPLTKYVGQGYVGFFRGGVRSRWVGWPMSRPGAAVSRSLGAEDHHQHNRRYSAPSSTENAAKAREGQPVVFRSEGAFRRR